MAAQNLEDTEWNDILKEKGILPKEPEVTEEDIMEMIDKTIAEKYGKKDLADCDLDELDELEDEEDDRVLDEYRRKRMAEMKAITAKEIFGTLQEISKTDYQVEVTESSKEVWVVVHLYQNYIPACKLLNAHLTTLSRKYKATKFLKIVADGCIPNYPDKNVPTFIIYGNGDVHAQLVGIHQLGGQNVQVDDVENLLHGLGALDTEKFQMYKKNIIKNALDREEGSSIRTGFTVSRESKQHNVESDDDDWN